jgi:toxin-antitoxin system PIN domain toxin
VLVNAVRRDAPRHVEYREWLNRVVQSRAQFAVSELVLSGFIRVMTNPVLARTGIESGDVFGFVRALTSRTNCVMVRPGPGQWPIFLRLCRETGASGDLVPDAYHAATAIEWGHEWISDDADFARFPGLRWRRPFN